MGSQTVSAGERVELFGEIDSDSVWSVDVEGGQIRLNQTRYLADDGPRLLDGDVAIVHQPQGSELWAYGDGGDATVHISKLRDGAGDFHIRHVIRDTFGNSPDNPVWTDVPADGSNLSDHIYDGGGDPLLAGLRTLPGLTGGSEMPAPITMQPLTSNRSIGATGILTYLDGALESVGEDSLLVSAPDPLPTDVQSDINRSLGTVREEYDEATESGTGLAADASLSVALSAPAADRLSGVVERASTSYVVSVEWLDSAGGSAVVTEEIGSGDAGAQVTIDVPARMPHANVVVADDGSGSGDVDLTAHLR